MNGSIGIKIGIAAVALVATMALPSGGQAVTPDLTTQKLLLEKEEGLKKAAEANGGAAGIKLAEYPNHFTMASYRNKSGRGELHEKYADIFYVIRGSATLLTGGKLLNPVVTSPGETLADSVQDGAETPLNEGDFIHIPAGVPHQLVIAPGKDFYYFVIKVKEAQ